MNVDVEQEFRTMRLEDKEPVIRLRRGHRGRHVGWPSDLPHAGTWSRDLDYVLVPSNRPGARANAALRDFPGLVDRSSEAEVLLLGPPELIRRLISVGPLWARAQRRRRGGPGNPEALAAWRASEDAARV